MNNLIGIAILPVIFLLNYIYKKDVNREPSKLLKKTFILGMITIAPSIFLEVLLEDIFPTDNYNSLISLFICVFISIALIEEFFKWLIVKKVAYNNDEFDETFDGIVYSIYSSLGFACLENIGLVILSDFKTGIFRAITAVPAHACDAVIMGYFFGKAKQFKYNHDSKKEKKYLFLSIFIPTLVHAIYDFLLFTKRDIFILIWILYIIIEFIICFNLVNKSSKNNDIFIKTDIQNSNNNFCVNCGTSIDNNDNFCKKCGTQIKRL